MTARPGDASPTQRLMACAAQLAQRYDLPQTGQLQTLIEDPDQDAGQFMLSRLSTALMTQARHELARSEEAGRGGLSYDLAASLARYCGWATTMACALRTAATAGSAAPPSDEAWDLLMSMSTLLYVRARITNTTYGLTTFYSDLAVALNEA